jgi:hypothetical protein
MWEKTKTKTTKYELEDLDIIINWAKVQLIQDDAKFDLGNHNGNLRHLLTNQPPKTQTLFRTYFSNNTNQEQEYSFKTERTTRQSCTFSFYKGFSREREGGINVKIPQDIIEIGGGIRSEQSIECGKDQTKEEEVRWGVDSMIRVRPNTRTQAALVINELELERDFSIEIRLNGRLTVNLNSKRENNLFVKSFSGDIVDIISRALERHWLPANASIFDIVDTNNAQKYARTIVRGRCKFRLGVEQHVTLNEQEIKN